MARKNTIILSNQYWLKKVTFSMEELLSLLLAKNSYLSLDPIRVFGIRNFFHLFDYLSKIFPWPVLAVGYLLAVRRPRQWLVNILSTIGVVLNVLCCVWLTDHLRRCLCRISRGGAKQGLATLQADPKILTRFNV